MRPALALAAALASTSLSAQFVPDARTVPAGALRVSFAPQYRSWNEVLDADGTQRMLGYRFLTDSTAQLLFLADGQGAVRSLIGDPDWLLRAGTINPRLDADARRFPFDFALGLTSWLTVRATIPVVTTTMNAFPLIDTAGANAGLATFDLASAQTASQGVLAAADQLAAAIGAGGFGCPGSAQCASAQALEARARTVATDLLALGASPLQPRAGSSAGQAIVATLAQLDADLQALGIAPAGVALTLPTTPLDTAGLNQVVTGHLGLAPLEPSKHTRKLGDIELGARIGLVQRAGLRLLADLTVTLPTASRGRPLDAIDLGPGDRQLDVTTALEAAVESDFLSLWARGAFTIQRPGTADLLPAPLAPAGAVTTAELDRGDVLEVHLWPGVRLTEGLRVMITADWYRRGDDAVDGVAQPGSDAQALAFGGGVWYRAARGRHADALPIEAGLVYRTVFTGSGGMVPRARQLDFALRLFYGL